MRNAGIPAVTRVDDQQDMNHRIRPLRRFNGFIQFYLASGIVGVRDNHNCFPACFPV